MHRPIATTVAILLPLATASVSRAGEIVDYSRPPPRYGAAASETHHIRDGVIRIDQRFLNGSPKMTLLRQRYTRSGQPFVFQTVRSADGRLLGVQAVDDPLTAPPARELRRETGRVETHLGRRCRVWEAVRPTSYQLTFVQSGCSTAEGIELWRRQASIDTIVAGRLRRAQVTAEEVRPPLEALDTTALMREAAGSDHSGDYEVTLAGDDGSSAHYRRSGNWRYVEEHDARSFYMTISNRLTGVTIDFSRDSDGTRRLGWSRPPWAPWPDKLRYGGRLLPGEPSQTILGERCFMHDMMYGVMDAGRVDCLTKDGVPLASSRRSWSSGRSLRAVRLSRAPVSLSQVSLARDVTDASAWRTGEAQSTGPR